VEVKKMRLLPNRSSLVTPGDFFYPAKTTLPRMVVVCVLFYSSEVVLSSVIYTTDFPIVILSFTIPSLAIFTHP